MKRQLKSSAGSRYRVLLTTVLLLGCGGAAPRSETAEPTADTSADGPAAADEPRRASKAGPPTSTDTEWLAILINGKKSGYVKSTRQVYPDRVHTEVTTSMEMRRGPDVTTILTVSDMTETPDGKPLAISKRTEGTGMRQVVSGTISPNGQLRLVIETAGLRTSREIPWPDGALLNEGQRLEALRYGFKPGVRYTSKYFDPDLLEALDVAVEVGGRQSLDLFGRVVEGTKVTLTMSVKGTSVELVMFVDDEMNTLKTTSSRMGMTIEMLACTEPFALSDNDPEALVRATVVPSPKPLSTKRRQAPVAYTLRRKSGAGSLLVPSTSEQTVRTSGERQIVAVKRVVPNDRGVRPYTGSDAAARAALEPNPWVQSDAAEIKRLAEEAVQGTSDALGAAGAIERFVADYIADKNFSVGYASALEVARSRQGDCTEHALLTTALARAAGIPAEVVFGLVYVERFEDARHVFGGHAWTRVFVGGEWISLDAAAAGFDTGHITLGISSGDPADFFSIVDSIGDLEIVAVE